MKVLLLLTLVCLSGCRWFGFGRHAAPEPTEFLVTGAPVNSIVFVDGAAAAAENPTNDQPQVIAVAPGPHTVEIRVGERTVYREQTDVAQGQQRVVRVLSGMSR